MGRIRLHSEDKTHSLYPNWRRTNTASRNLSGVPAETYHVHRRVHCIEERRYGVYCHSILILAEKIAEKIPRRRNPLFDNLFKLWCVVLQRGGWRRGSVGNKMQDLRPVVVAVLVATTPIWMGRR